MATTALTLTLLFVCTNAFPQKMWDAELYGNGFEYDLTYDTYDTASRAYDTYDIIRDSTIGKYSYDENNVLPAETIFESSSRTFYDNLFVVKDALNNISTKMLSLFSDLETPTFTKAKLDLLISETQSENRILEAVYKLAPYKILFD